MICTRRKGNRKSSDTPDGDVDVEPAALLLLKLNRILYESICRRKNVDK